MRRQRQGRDGRHLSEAHALGGEPIEHRGMCPLVPVAAKTVGAKGIDGNQEDVERPALALLPDDDRDHRDRDSDGSDNQALHHMRILARKPLQHLERQVGRALDMHVGS
jgi:hypothetical protein